jgi:hypothetical protein
MTGRGTWSTGTFPGNHLLWFQPLLVPYSRIVEQLRRLHHIPDMRLRSGLGISWSWSATTGHQVALTDKERFWEAQEEKAFVDFTS